jgi:hypothetical protein
MGRQEIHTEFWWEKHLGKYVLGTLIMKLNDNIKMNLKDKDSNWFRIMSHSGLWH